MTSSPRSSSRRAVLKGAAWTAPAIVLVTAAPAMAVSPARLRVTSPTAVRGGNGFGRTITVTATITNLAADATTLFRVVLSVTLGATNQWEILGGFTPATATAAGYSGAVVTGTGTTRNFTFTANNQLNGLDSTSFNAVISTGSGFNPNGTVVIEAQPTGTSPSPANGSASVTFP